MVSLGLKHLKSFRIIGELFSSSWIILGALSLKSVSSIVFLHENIVIINHINLNCMVLDFVFVPLLKNFPKIHFL